MNWILKDIELKRTWNWEPDFYWTRIWEILELYSEKQRHGLVSEDAEDILALENLDEFGLGQVLIVVLVVLVKVAVHDLRRVLVLLAAQLEYSLVQSDHLCLVDLLVMVDLQFWKNKI